MKAEWGFRPIRTKVGGTPTPLTDKAPIAAGTVIEMFELVKISVGTGVVALGAINIDGTDALYVAGKKSTSSDTFTEIPLYGGSQTLFMVAVKEIAEGTVLTATGGSGTTFVDSSLVIADGTYGNDLLKGAVLEVDSCASGDASDGDELTLTGYTASSGTCTFASVGSTGFTSGDKAHFTKLGTHIFGAYSLGIEYSGSDDTDGCRLQLDGGDGSSRAVRVVGWNDARTKLIVQIIASPDQAIATQDT